MMNNNAGFRPSYPYNQDNYYQQFDRHNNNGFHRTNTYIPQMPENPFQNPDYFQPPQMNSQNIQHSNTYMNQQTQPQYQNFPQNNPYMPPPPIQNPQPSQSPYFNRSNTYMAPSQPQYPPQPQNQQQYFSPSQQQNPYIEPLPQIQRANTYCQQPPKRKTIYDTLDVRPHKFAPENQTKRKMQMENYGNNNFGRPSTSYERNYSNSNNQINLSSSYYNNFPGIDNFNPEEDCKVLRNAVHGWGTDEKAIINVIVNRNAAQRAEIRRVYKACFGKDLIKRLKEDTSGNFKDIICAMFMTPAEYDAYCLYKAMKGLGTKEGVLIEIIGTRSCQQLQEIKDIFEKEYKNSLENWIKGDTSGNFKLLLIALLQCNRSDNPNPNINACQADAEALYKAGEGRWGTDEATFIRIFANRSAAELACINQCYLKMRGKGLLHAIDKEFSGDIKKLLQTIVGGLLDIHGYFAMRIRESVKGLGTNDSKLVRVIVSRCEIDLPQIKEAYQRIYQRNLLYDVRDDTSGYYRNILTCLISRC